MTGCPYDLIYSSSHTFDRLRAQRRLTYRAGLLALHLEEADGEPQVVARDTTTGRLERLRADRVFVACGGVGTTRLVLGSLRTFDEAVYLQESVQFVMPTASMRPVRDPRTARNFTLNQFNVLFDVTGEGVDLCQVHFYDYNPAFLGSLPAALGRPAADPALTALLRRVSVGLGYVPGWGSPRGQGRRPAGPRREGRAPRPGARRGTPRADGPTCCRPWSAPCSRSPRPWISGPSSRWSRCPARRRAITSAPASRTVRPGVPG